MEMVVCFNQHLSEYFKRLAPILVLLLFTGRVSKFRHLKGSPGHKSTHIENIRNISRQISGECDGFHANRERVAVPLSGPGGRIAVLELSRVGKLPDGVIPALVHGANVMDFAWDPFNCSRLAVGKVFELTMCIYCEIDHILITMLTFVFLT